jgi:hypothetical protein
VDILFGLSVGLPVAAVRRCVLRLLRLFPALLLLLLLVHRGSASASLLRGLDGRSVQFAPVVHDGE